MPSEGPRAVRRTEPTGIATSNPIAAATNVQPSGASRQRMEPASNVPSAGSVVFKGAPRPVQPGTTSRTNERNAGHSRSPALRAWNENQHRS